MRPQHGTAKTTGQRSRPRLVTIVVTALALAALALLCGTAARWSASREPLAQAAARRPGGGEDPPSLSARPRSGANDGIPAASPEPGASAGPPPAIEVRQAQLIEAIDVEPDAPCMDDEVLVRVRLIPLGRESKVFIGGKPGDRAFMRFSKAGLRSVPIVARDWHDEIEHRRVAIDVGNCAARAAARVEVRRFANGRVLARATWPAATAHPGYTHFDWDFGDGQRAATATAWVEHDYTLRHQSAPTTTFVLTMEAHGASGHSVAHATVTFVNADLIAARAGVSTLPVRYDRFARRDAGGAAVADLELRNILPVDVRWEAIETTAFPCDGDAAPRHASVAALGALSRESISTGAIEAVHLTVPAEQLGPDACRLQVWLRGRAGGATVSAPLALELGVPKTAIPVRDPRLLAQVAKAMRLFGSNHVTPEDFARAEAMADP